MKIETGKGRISLVALIAIWSVSALTSLPGLAISPILGDLEKIFPHAGELDIQMLTSLPSLLTIPFILIAGHISQRVGYIRLLCCGLSVFLVSGILYLFANYMWQLVTISALLGVGAGIIIPLSTALVSRFFYGEYRTRQFGYSSAITNVALVLATMFTGYLAQVEWRLPFLVYLLPAVSLFLLPFISSADAEMPALEKADTSSHVAEKSAGAIAVKPLLAYMIYYLLITFLTVVISFNLPFAMSCDGYDSAKSGIIISLFYLAIMLPGFFLNAILKFIGKRVEEICLLMIAVGLSIIFLYHSLLLVAIGCFITGFGYGVAQPFVYDKASSFASPGRVTFALALVMTMNYVAILASPFILDGLQAVLHIKSERFAFGANVIMAFVALLIIGLLRFRNNRDGK